MLRGLLFAGLVFAGACGLTRAADPSPVAGKWKITIPAGERADDFVTLMVGFTEKDGKWSGEYLSSTDKLTAEPSIKSVNVNGDTVRFVIEFRGKDFVSFDGNMTRDKKKIAGSMSLLGQPLMLTELYPSKLKSLTDPVDVARETLSQVESGPTIFDAAMQVVSRAGVKKIPADEVRALVDRVNKAAAGYGPRWERQMTLRLARALSTQNGLEEIAVAQAKRAERLLTDDDDIATRLSVLEAIIQALAKAGKTDEVKPYLAQIPKLEVRDYADYSKAFPFKTKEYAGRKDKSDRAMLVELFTGAECPPCVAADLAFDGLLKTYKPSEAIFLEYHLHIPGPDPLTSPDGTARAEVYYGDQVEGTPTVIISGRRSQAGPGSAAVAEKVYEAFRATIDRGLEKPAGAKLALTIAKNEKGAYSAKASVSDLETPGNKMMLRFALAEERVRYPGGNGMRYHHMVVRAMPGGVKGFPLPQKTTEQTVAFDPEALKEVLNKSLDDFATKEEIAFPRPDRPLSMKNLKLVAFIQNDETKEVLQAVQVDVEGK